MPLNMAAAKVAAGFEDLVAAGGVESMSRLGIGASGGAQGDPWSRCARCSSRRAWAPTWSRR